MSDYAIKLVVCDARTAAGRRAMSLAAGAALVVSVEHARWAVRIRDSRGNVLAERAIQSEQVADEKIELTVGAHHFNAWTRYAELSVETREQHFAHPRSDGRESEWRRIDTLIVRGARARALVAIGVAGCAALTVFWIAAPAASRARRILDWATAAAAALPLVAAFAARRPTPRVALASLFAACVASIASLWQTATIDNQREPVEGPGFWIERGPRRWARWEVRPAGGRLAVRGYAVELGPRCALSRMTRFAPHSILSSRHALTLESGVVDIDRAAVRALHLQRHATCDPADSRDEARCCVTTSATTEFAPEPAWRPIEETGYASALVSLNFATHISSRFLSVDPRVSNVLGPTSWALFDDRQPALVLSWAHDRVAHSRFAPSLRGSHIRGRVHFADHSWREVRCAPDPQDLWAAHVPSGTIEHVSAGAMDAEVVSGRAVACGTFWSLDAPQRLVLRVHPSNGATLRWDPKWASFTLPLHPSWSGVALVSQGRELGALQAEGGAFGPPTLVAVHVGESLGAVQSVATSLDPRGTIRPQWRSAEPSNLVFFAIDVDSEMRAMMTRLPSRNAGTRLFVTTAGDAQPQPALLWHSAEGWQLDARTR